MKYRKEFLLIKIFILIIKAKIKNEIFFYFIDYHIIFILNKY